MDQPTREIYEANAARWLERRRPKHGAKAKALAARSEPPSIDLGCGPGWYTGLLPQPAVAFDVTQAMLDIVPQYAPGAWRVQGDLAHLPFRPATFATAWARNSYVHLRQDAVPMALADLHRALRADAHATLTLFGGEREGRDVFADDDFPGRYFSTWDVGRLRDVVLGAGFDIDALHERGRQHGDRSFEVEVTRARTLPDIVGPGLRLLVCGLNPSLYSADRGIGFARPGNRFWPAALAAGIASIARDPWLACQEHGVGFTDLVKRATVAAAELSADEFREGLERVERLVAWLQPGVVAFVGLAGWRAAVDKKAIAGPQERTIGGRPVYVMPSSSGLNAHSSVASLAEHLRAAAALA